MPILTETRDSAPRAAFGNGDSSKQWLKALCAFPDSPLLIPQCTQNWFDALVTFGVAMIVTAVATIYITYGGTGNDWANIALFIAAMFLGFLLGYTISERLADSWDRGMVVSISGTAATFAKRASKKILSSVPITSFEVHLFLRKGDVSELVLMLVHPDPSLNVELGSCATGWGASFRYGFAADQTPDDEQLERIAWHIAEVLGRPLQVYRIAGLLG